MAVTATIIPKPGSGEPIMAMGDLWTFFVSLSFSGSYSTGGDSLDFTSFLQGPAAGATVLMVDVSGGAGTTFEYDKTNKKLKGFSAANTELTAAAYNAALTGDTNVIAQVVAG
jgi:hypothetical protein